MDETVIRSFHRLNDMWVLDLTSLDSALWQEVRLLLFFTGVSKSFKRRSKFERRRINIINSL